MRYPSNKPSTEEREVFVPKPISLSNYHSADAPRDLEIQALIHLQPDERGWLTVTRGDGKSFQLRKQEDILLLFPEKFNFTYGKFNEVDCITKVLDKKQRACLSLYHHAPIQVNGFTYNLFWIPGTAKVRLQVGGNTASSKFLINVANFTPSRYVHPMTNPLKDIELLSNKLLMYHKNFPVNILSPASTSKDILLSENGNEFYTFEELVSRELLTPEDLDYFHTAYRGGRQESSQLGTFDGDNGDLEKAYLEGLGNCPGLYHNILDIYRGTQFMENAHPGSWYKVRVTIPPVADTSFPPLPFRLDLVYYPTGEFTSWLSKPYVEMIREVGIDFTILESCQIQLQNPNYKPFKDLAQYLKFFEDNYRAKLFPIGVKTTHVPMVGHFLTIYEEIDENTLNSTWKTSQDYCPLFACAIQGGVAKYIWEQSQVNDSVAIGVDKLYGRHLKLGKGFKPIESGLHTFLTPNFKDNPGESVYRSLIEKNRDKHRIPLTFQRRISFQEGSYANTTGALINYTINILPTSGNRFLRDEIKRVGELLEGGKQAVVPSVDRLLREGSTCLVKLSASKIDAYLNFLQKTQT